MNCILCESPQTIFFQVSQKPAKDYHWCENCDLIFMEPDQRLTAQEEKARYDLHENEGCLGHLAFLEPLVKEVDSYLTSAGLMTSNLSCLDYGCGPNPSLSTIFSQKGYKTNNYDLYYYPDQEQLRRSYHVVTSTEVWEHFYEPRKEIERQLRMLKPGGLLAVMTSAHRGQAAFHNWHYRRDLTHVTFFSEKTMDWVVKKFGLRVMKAKSPYWVFQK